MRKIFGERLSDIIGDVLLPGGIYETVKFVSCIGNDPASRATRTIIKKFRDTIDNAENKPKRHDRNGSVE